MAVTLRTCIRCEEIKPLEEFHLRSDRVGMGYGQGCKVCYREVLSQLRAIRRGDPKPPAPLLDRFERHYQPIPWTGCWIWTGGLSGSPGYKWAQLNVKNESGKWVPEPAYRTSWKLHKGEIPEGMWVLHSCDNPLCVNPAHLFLGTPMDNTLDMMRKGRHSTQKTKEIQWQ